MLRLNKQCIPVGVDKMLEYLGVEYTLSIKLESIKVQAPQRNDYCPVYLSFT
jgi:hypothetical protein